MTTQHTQGTWEVSKHGTPDSHPQYGIHNGGSNDFIIVKGENAKADAEVIILACNNHYNLMESLKDSIKKMEEWEVMIDWEWGSGRSLEKIEKDGDLCAALVKAKAAVAKAKGE